MSDHAKYRFDAPIDHSFNHDIGNGLFSDRLFFQPEIDTVFSDIQRVKFLPRIFVAAWRFPGQWIKIPSMPRASQPALAIGRAFDRTLSKGAALMGAVIVHGHVLSVDMGQGHAFGLGGNGFYPAFG